MATSAFPRPQGRQRRWLAEQLRNEAFSGGLLLAAAAIAIGWANSPWQGGYHDLISLEFGSEALHLRMSLGHWAADGLLTLFFFIVGLELKHELVLGSLSRVSQAVVPIAAAVGGMLLPAAIFTVVNLFAPGGDLTGWGIPMATDIAFALAVLAVAGRHLPSALRAFLLTSAVVDDLGAILVIALFYSGAISVGHLLAAALVFACYGWAQRRGIDADWITGLALLTGWWLLHQSGVHATVAGVAVGLLTRVATREGERESPADRLSRRLHPVSAGFAVPVFAFAAAGVTLPSGAFGDFVTPVSIGIALALLIGKPLGVAGTAWLVARFTRAELNPEIQWGDVRAVGLLSGIGFTVALLVAELGYRGTEMLDPAKAAVMAASLVSAGLAVIAMRRRRQRVD